MKEEMKIEGRLKEELMRVLLIPANEMKKEELRKEETANTSA